MIIRRTKIDPVSVEQANDRQKSYIKAGREIVRKADDDPYREKRLEKQECIICYGSSRIGGAAISMAQCGLCDEILHSSNTNIDVLCIKCAKAQGLCKHCGADIDLKNRRRRQIPLPTPTRRDLV